jgi:hypothetical protein
MSVEVAGRPASFDEIPASARKLGDRAEKVGWHVDYSYAKGRLSERLKSHDSLVVRFAGRPGKTAIVACYEDGGFRCGLTPMHRLNMRELVALLEDPQSLTGQVAV